MTWQSVGTHTFVPTDKAVQVGSFDLAAGQDTIWVKITQLNNPGDWPWSYGILSWRNANGLPLGSIKAYSTRLGEVFRLGNGLPPSDGVGSIWFEPRGFNLGWLKAGFPWELQFEAQAGSTGVSTSYWNRDPVNGVLSPVTPGDDVDLGSGGLNVGGRSTFGAGSAGLITFSNPGNKPSIFLSPDNVVNLIEISTVNQGSLSFTSTDGLKDRGQIAVDTGGRFVIDARATNPLVCKSGGAQGTQQSGTDWVPYSSEARLKNVVGVPDQAQCWDLIKSIKLHCFYYKDDAQSGVPYLGPMAGELEALDPTMLIDTGRSDDQGAIRTYNKPLLEAKALIALQAALRRIEALEARLAH